MTARALSHLPRRGLTTTAEAENMSWSTYLPLRQGERRAALFTAIPSTLLGGGLGGGYFASIEADPTQTVMGLEPIYFYGLCTIGCIGAGYMAGSLLGASGWRLLHRKVLPQMERRNTQFQAHLARFRADPSRQSVSNPVPDYYGEKIGSLQQYRQWLRDQRAYQRKAAFGSGGTDRVARGGAAPTL